MTEKECILRLTEEKKNYIAAKDELDEKHRRESTSILNEWAKSNAKYGIGDIIRSNDIIILVNSILGYCTNFGYQNKLYVIYKGRALTTKLQPRKDGWVTTIHDDGREIKLVRKAEK